MKEIQLTQGKVAIVDAADYDWLMLWTWHYTAQGYAASRTYRRYVLMHRLIACTPKGADTDHINGNKVDNRRCNLRPCTRSQNNANKSSYGGSSSFKGVYWSERDGKWQAQYHCEGKSHSIGFFSDEREAAAAYDQAAQRIYGEFAKLNFPKE